MASHAHQNQRFSGCSEYFIKKTSPCQKRRMGLISFSLKSLLTLSFSGSASFSFQRSRSSRVCTYHSSSRQPDCRKVCSRVGDRIGARASIYGNSAHTEACTLSFCGSLSLTTCGTRLTPVLGSTHLLASARLRPFFFASKWTWPLPFV